MSNAMYKYKASFKLQFNLFAKASFSRQINKYKGNLGSCKARQRYSWDFADLPIYPVSFRRLIMLMFPQQIYVFHFSHVLHRLSVKF